MNQEATLAYIKQHGILPESKFGQNFLCDEEVIASIIDLAGIEPHAKVLEIGPGIGALTRELSKLDIDLTAVEIDKRLAELLRNDPEIKADVIDRDYLKLKDYGAGSFDIIISNLPYYVMTDIMKKIFAECINARKMVFMVEEDAIQRINARSSTKQYGPLAVLVGTFGLFEECMRVPGHCFVPKPRTMSAVISLTREGRASVLSPEYIRFIDSCFAQRRKKMINSLTSYPKDKVLSALADLGLESAVRAEELSPETFNRLYDAIIS